MSREDGVQATAARPLDVSACILAQAEAEFGKGDMQQASGKAWEAVAHCAAPAARVNRWPNGSREEMARNVRRLLDLTPDPRDNRNKFALINYLHVNYFDYELDPEDVALAIRDARDLVDAIRDVAPANGRGPGASSDRPGQAIETDPLDVATCLLVQAETAFENGDVALACKKAWDAVERCAESAFRENGWPDGSDGDVRKGINRLLDRTPDPGDNRTRLAALSYLHVNYFDEERFPQDVAGAIGDAHVLVDAIRGLETVGDA